MKKYVWIKSRKNLPADRTIYTRKTRHFFKNLLTCSALVEWGGVAEVAAGACWTTFCTLTATKGVPPGVWIRTGLPWRMLATFWFRAADTWDSKACWLVLVAPCILMPASAPANVEVTCGRMEVFRACDVPVATTWKPIYIVLTFLQSSFFYIYFKTSRNRIVI